MKMRNRFSLPATILLTLLSVASIAAPVEVYALGYASDGALPIDPRPAADVDRPTAARLEANRGATAARNADNQAQPPSNSSNASDVPITRVPNTTLTNTQRPQYTNARRPQTPTSNSGTSRPSTTRPSTPSPSPAPSQTPAPSAPATTAPAQTSAPQPLPPTGNINVITYLNDPTKPGYKNARIGGIKVKVVRQNGANGCLNRHNAVTGITNQTQYIQSKGKKILVHGTLHYLECNTGPYKVTYVGRKGYRPVSGTAKEKSFTLDNDETVVVTFVVNKVTK